MNPQRIYMMTSGQIVGGPIVFSPFVKVQTRALQQRGVSVTIGIVDDRTSMRGVLRNLRRIRREIAALRPDVVHVQYGSMMSMIAACARGNSKLVISFIGSDLLGSHNAGVVWMLRDFIGRRLGLIAARRAAAINVVSENLYNALPRHLRRKAFIMPNGIDVNIFVPMDKSECRQKLGWPTEAQEKIVLFNASTPGNQPVKNAPLAHAAIEGARRTFPEVRLQAISGVPHELVPVMMNAADCLLVTSLSEGSPNFVQEAMACNLPVVSVPCGDVAQRTRQTSPGEVCPYDPELLGAALVKVFGSASRSNGREQLEAQELTSAHVAEKLIKLYSIVQGSPEQVKTQLAMLCAA
jgi:glycosyltransferase involved in cell wall biosynthesis